MPHQVGALIDAARQSLPEGGAAAAGERSVRPTSRRAQWAQTLLGVPLHILVGMRWLTYLMAAKTCWRRWQVSPPRRPCPGGGWCVLAGVREPGGRMAISVAAARLLLRNVVPGSYPRSGAVHLRLWLAEQIQDLAGAISLASAPWVPYYARALGATIGSNVQLHSLPPVTGMLSLGTGCNIEPEVDLSGWWIDGDSVHIGAIRIGAGAVVGARSTLMPGASIGAGAQVEPGSAVRAGSRPATWWPGPRRSAAARPNKAGRTARRSTA